jgi:hypothetical protein
MKTRTGSSTPSTSPRSWEDVLDIVDTLLVDAAKKVKEQEQEQGNQGLKGDPGDEDDDSETPESEPTDDDATDSSESDSSESTEQSNETPDIKSDTVQRSATQQKFEDSMEEFREKQTRWGDDGVDQIESVPVFNPEDCMTDWTALYNADSTLYGGEGGMDKYYTNEKLTSDGLDEVSRSWTSPARSAVVWLRSSFASRRQSHSDAPLSRRLVFSTCRRW